MCNQTKPRGLFSEFYGIQIENSLNHFDTWCFLFLIMMFKTSNISS